MNDNIPSIPAKKHFGLLSKVFLPALLASYAYACTTNASWGYDISCFITGLGNGLLYFIPDKVQQYIYNVPTYPKYISMLGLPTDIVTNASRNGIYGIKLGKLVSTCVELRILGISFRGFTDPMQEVSHWRRDDTKKPLRSGSWVTIGTSKGIFGLRNWIMSGSAMSRGYKFSNGFTKLVSGNQLRYPIHEDGYLSGLFKGLKGERIVVLPEDQNSKDNRTISKFGKKLDTYIVTSLLIASYIYWRLT